MVICGLNTPTTVPIRLEIAVGTIFARDSMVIEALPSRISAPDSRISTPSSSCCPRRVREFQAPRDTSSHTFFQRKLDIFICTWGRSCRVNLRFQKAVYAVLKRDAAPINHSVGLKIRNVPNKNTIRIISPYMVRMDVRSRRFVA